MAERVDDGTARAGRNRTQAVLALVNLTVLVFLVVAAVVILSRRREERRAPAAPAAPAASPARADEEGVMTATLFFVAPDAERLVPEPREVAVGADGEEALRRVVDELARGPTAGAAPVLPAGAAVRRVFRGEDGTIAVDFDAGIRNAPWGGPAAERIALRALAETIGANFPDVRAVRLLVEGSAVETLWGHVATDRPIPVRP